MNKRLRIALMLILLVILLGSVGMMIDHAVQYREGEETYAEAAELANLPDLSDVEESAASSEEPAASSEGTSSDAASSQEPASQQTPSETKPVYVDPYAKLLRDMDFAALRKVNGDILGWILIPDTVISYPLLQGSDNQYYLNHTWKKWTSIVGSIFMEYTNSSDFSDFNTIVYGHNMNNGSMFGTLKKYKSFSYWKAHPYVYINTDGGSRKYRIFAAYEVSTQGTTYQMGFPSDKSKQAFLDYCVSHSVIDTGVSPTVYDHILTLSTCTGNGHTTRWVVQARLKGSAPVAPAQNTTAPAVGLQETQPEEQQTPGETGAASSASGTGAESTPQPAGAEAGTAADQTPEG